MIIRFDAGDVFYPQSPLRNAAKKMRPPPVAVTNLRRRYIIKGPTRTADDVFLIVIFYRKQPVLIVSLKMTWAHASHA